MFALVAAIATLVWCGWVVLTERIAPVLAIPPAVIAGLLFLIALRPLSSQRRRQWLALGWFVYSGGMLASLLALSFFGVRWPALTVLVLLLLMGTTATMRGVYLITRRPRYSLRNYYDG